MAGKGRSHLTLAEPVLVIAIVGVLASMLVPVFARARGRARQAVCLANIKTIAAAIRMYVADNDDLFPPDEHDPEVLAYFNRHPGGRGKEDWDYGPPPLVCHRARQADPYLRWPVILDRYLPRRDVWHCGSAVLQGGASFINGVEDWLGHLQADEGEWGWQSDPWMCPIPSWPYGWGGEVTDSLTQKRMAVPVSGKGRTASAGMFVQSIGANSGACFERSARAVEEPAWYVICADAGATVDDFCTGTLAYPDLCHLECAGPGDWEADWENCSWSGECGAIGEMKTDPELRKPYARHFGGVNVGFLDGHARWMDSEKVIEESASHGDPRRGRLRGYGPWGPTKDAPWYDSNDGIIPLY